MAYTNIWDDTKPTGSEPANTIDDLMRSMKVDIEQRFNDMFAMPSFATDPLRLYGLKFTDAQDAVINLGDNGGPSRSLIVKDKAGANTYLTVNSVNIIASTLTLIKYANPEFRIAGSAINQNLNQTFYDNGATEKGHIIYAGANSVSNRYFGIFSDAADFLLVATLNNVPIQIWTNSILAITIGTNQVVTLATGLVVNGTAGLTINGTGQTTIQPTIAAGGYGAIIVGASGAARDILAVGQTGVTSGFTVQWNGSNMVYTFQGGGVTISIGGLTISGGGLTVSSGDSIFAAGIKQTGTVVTRIENSFGSVPAGSTGVGIEIGVNATPAAQFQSFNRTSVAFSPLLIQGSYVEIGQGPLLLGLTVTGGAVQGNVVVPNNTAYMGMNAAGSTALALLSVDASNQTNINLNSAKLALVNAVISSTASVGPNTLPAGCAGYLTIVMGGNTNKIPFYAN